MQDAVIGTMLGVAGLEDGQTATLLQSNLILIIVSLRVLGLLLVMVMNIGPHFVQYLLQQPFVTIQTASSMYFLVFSCSPRQNVLAIFVEEQLICTQRESSAWFLVYCLASSDLQHCECTFANLLILS
jgi:hypothetical protein